MTYWVRNSTPFVHRVSLSKAMNKLVESIRYESSYQWSRNKILAIHQLLSCKQSSIRHHVSCAFQNVHSFTLFTSIHHCSRSSVRNESTRSSVNIRFFFFGFSLCFSSSLAGESVDLVAFFQCWLLKQWNCGLQVVSELSKAFFRKIQITPKFSTSSRLFFQP